MDIQLAREQMIDQQIRAWEVLDTDVLSVMSQVPRERFVPAAYRDLAFADTAIALPEGQFMLPPKVEGRVLQALGILPGNIALEIGTGSGFMAACMAALGAKVTSLEIRPTLAVAARAALDALGIANVQIEQRDGARLNSVQKYDVIAVTGSVAVWENSYAEALKIGGRLFVAVGSEPVMDAMLVTRTGERDWIRESLFETVIPPLDNILRPAQFRF